MDPKGEHSFNREQQVDSDEEMKEEGAQAVYSPET